MEGLAHATEELSTAPSCAAPAVGAVAEEKVREAVRMLCHREVTDRGESICFHQLFNALKLEVHA